MKQCIKNYTILFISSICLSVKKKNNDKLYFLLRYENLEGSIFLYIIIFTNNL